MDRLLKPVLYIWHLIGNPALLKITKHINVSKSRLNDQNSSHFIDNNLISETRCPNLSTVAGVPVKYGKCVSVKYSV